MTSINIPDLSEFQPDVNFGSINTKAAIIRTSYGTGHKDQAWYGGQRRAAANQHLDAVGFYHYLTQGQDPVAQAKFMASIIGKLGPKEFVFCDLEESAGSDETGRAHAFATTIDSLVGGHSHLYSYGYFIDSHLAGAFAPGGALHDRHLWLAAYQPNEPTRPHSLWQNTDHGVNGTLTSDSSIFHGSAADMLALFGKPNPTPHGGGAGPVKTAPTVSRTKRGQVSPGAHPTPDWYHRPLGAGAKGADVKAVQETICPNHLTSVMDPATVTALKDWQHGQHIASDGVVGPVTSHQIAVYWHAHHDA